MDDLISRKQIMDEAERLSGPMTGDGWDNWGVYVLIERQPSVPAVPLDKLCEWLNVHCGRPNYCNDRLCGECNLDDEGFEYEPCWKTLLTEWMEEQNGTDNP